jgi:hypothetical protein
VIAALQLQSSQFAACVKDKTKEREREREKGGVGERASQRSKTSATRVEVGAWYKPFLCISFLSSIYPPVGEGRGGI